jgi:hypothetical protein
LVRHSSSCVPLSTAENTRWKQKSTWEEAGRSGVSRMDLTENLSSVMQGGSRKRTWQYLNMVGGFLDWIAKRRCKLANIDEHVVERYLRHRDGGQSILTGDRAALKRWLSVLRDEGATLPGGARRGHYGSRLRRSAAVATPAAMALLTDFQTQYQVSSIADPDIEALPDRTAVRDGITEARCRDVIGVGESVPTHCEAL